MANLVHYLEFNGLMKDFLNRVFRPDGEVTPGTGPVSVGWCLNDDTAAIIYPEPERLRSEPPNKSHAKSASRCPAILNLESRYFVVRCPFDLHLKFARDDDGKARLVNGLGDKSPVRVEKLAQHVLMTREPEWRFPDRPTLQLRLPYIFVADEPVYLSQIDAFAHYRSKPLPGTIFGGRFPIHIWPRPLVWAFEWHDVETEIVLKRNDPLFYVMFETLPQNRAVQLVEIERTPELERFSQEISEAANYVNQTFSLFDRAEKRRPAQLVNPVRKRRETS